MSIVLWFLVGFVASIALLGILGSDDGCGCGCLGVGLAIVIVLVIGAWVLVVKNLPESDPSVLSHLVTEDVQVSQSYGTLYKLSGRCTNTSNRTITDLEFRLVIEDCSEDQSDCVTVGDEYGKISVTIPPNQVRGFEVSFRFPNLSVKGTPSYTYSVTEAYVEKLPW